MDKVCVVIGANQAGVSFAFALRQEGWEGEIILFDKDPMLPYSRPPLSKAALTGTENLEDHILKPLELYQRENITLKLGSKVETINRENKNVELADGSTQHYDTLVLATGSRPVIPKIPDIEKANNVFTLRTVKDSIHIRQAIITSKHKRAVIIGGGYIGLEAAASLKKLGADVTVLEREERVLARVTAPEMSQFFESLHTENGVQIFTSENVVGIETVDGVNKVNCANGFSYEADVIIVGVGVHVNKELAEKAKLEVKDGILVDAQLKTSDKNIYAIGDCTYHHNPYYGRFVRLESIQNASDQAKIAAEVITGKNLSYKALPWFWSDQYDVKLQMVGLSEGYTEALVRREKGDNKRFSVWYFKDEKLLAVDAVNNTKAYVIGTKFIKAGILIDKSKLVDHQIEFKPANLSVG